MFDDVLALVAARARRDELMSATWEGRQPYRALAAYEPQDADLFVGRERLVAELAARVVDRRLVAVIGASGSGKSSLLHVIGAMDRPTSGEILVASQSLTALPQDALIRFRRHGGLRVPEFQSDSEPDRTRKRDAPHGVQRRVGGAA